MATPPDFTAGAVLTAAQMNAVGLWLVKTKTFTNQTEVIFDNCFTDDYDNYKLIFSVNSTAATDAGLLMQYGNGATFHATTYAYWNYYHGVPGSGNFSNTNFTGTSIVISQIGGDKPPTISSVEIYGPKLALRTAHTMQSFATYFSGGVQNRVALFGSGSHDQATAYASLKVFNSTASNMTGRASIYGFNK